jgi:4-hydroxy-tetrahydrodipicolinate synthase
MTIKKGIYAASMSVFKGDLSLDVDFTIRHAEKVIQDGCHGAVIFGSTGQAQLISSIEKKRLIEKLSLSKFKDSFIIGTGNNSLNENIGLMKHCINNGFKKFLIMPPAYYVYSDDGAYSFFENLIKEIKTCEIILYNFEKLCGYKFSSEIVKKLVKNFPEQIVGVKDSTYNLYEKIKIPNFLIFPGSETKLLKSLELGCSGIISAVCNVTAPLARKVYEDYLDKNKKENFNEKLCAVRKVFDGYNLISGLHSFMSIEEPKYKNVLPPLNILNDTDQKELLKKLKELDFSPIKKIAA